MLRGFLSQDRDDKGRVFGTTLEVSNKGGTIWARLYSKAGREKGYWDHLKEVLLWDVSISEVTSGKIIYKSVLVRILRVKYDEEENILKVFEIEPGAIIPP